MKKLIIYSKSEDYFNKILKEIKKSKHKVCYISLNKTAGFLQSSFKKNKIKNNIYIIDLISQKLKKKKPKTCKDCDFLNSSCRLDEISNSIKKVVKKGYKLIIFDSLSNLFTCYLAEGSDEGVLKEFLDSLPNTNYIFITSKNDEEKPAIQKILKFFKVYEKEFRPIGIG